MTPYLGYLAYLLYDMLNLRPTEFEMEIYNVMDSVPFTDFVGNDINRAIDGKLLRNEYFEHCSPNVKVEDEDFFERPCSVLEMCIALSRRMFDIMQDVPGAPASIAQYFEIMVDNLNLYDYNDIPDPEEAMFDTVETFAFRLYAPDGTGGIFPLQNPDRDQREVELWYQMSAYLAENWPIT